MLQNERSNSLCYLRWGEDGEAPSDWKNAEAQKNAWKRARMPGIGCTLCQVRMH
ncbi:MAG: hypothetical protein HPY85_13255 [Anaerolineae bacterium]|nr:hypothetical protein [Anaerolineae bacterium]